MEIAAEIQSRRFNEWRNLILKSFRALGTYFAHSVILSESNCISQCGRNFLRVKTLWNKTLRNTGQIALDPVFCWNFMFDFVSFRFSSSMCMRVRLSVTAGSSTLYSVFLIILLSIFSFSMGEVYFRVKFASPPKVTNMKNGSASPYPGMFGTVPAKVLTQWRIQSCWPRHAHLGTNFFFISYFWDSLVSLVQAIAPETHQHSDVPTFSWIRLLSNLTFTEIFSHIYETFSHL